MFKVIKVNIMFEVIFLKNIIVNVFGGGSYWVFFNRLIFLIKLFIKSKYFGFLVS